MSLRFNRSRDGRQRASVNLGYRVDREDLTVAVLWLLVDNDDVDAREFTRREVEAELRRGLRSRGEAFWYAGDRFDGVTLEHATREAEETVTRLWPELS